MDIEIHRAVRRGKTFLVGCFAVLLAGSLVVPRSLWGQAAEDDPLPPLPPTQEPPKD